MIEPNSNSIGESVPVDILAEWEGPAIPALGIFFELPNIEHAGVEVDVAALVAGWIAVTAISGEVGNTVHEGLKKESRWGARRLSPAIWAAKDRRSEAGTNSTNGTVPAQSQDIGRRIKGTY